MSAGIGDAPVVLRLRLPPGIDRIREPKDRRETEVRLQILKCIEPMRDEECHAERQCSAKSVCVHARVERKARSVAHRCARALVFGPDRYGHNNIDKGCDETDAGEIGRRDDEVNGAALLGRSRSPMRTR